MLPRELPQRDQGRVRAPVAPAAAPTNDAAGPLYRPGPLPPALARPFGLSNLLRALRHQWVLGLSAGLAAGVVVGCVAYALLPAWRSGTCTARAAVQVRAAPQVIVNSTGPQTDFTAIQARVRSRPVLDAVLRNPEVRELPLLTGQPDPYEFLQSELVAYWSAYPEELTIQLTGDRPKELAALVNAVADAVVRDVNGRDVGDRERQVERLEKVHKEYETSLAPRRKRLAELARGAGAEPGERALRQIFAALSLNTLQAELLRVQSERRSAEALLKAASGSRPAEGAPRPDDVRPAFDEVMKNDPELQPLMTQIGELNGQIARYMTLYKDDPVKAREVIEAKGLQAQIDSLYALGRRQYEKKLKAIGGRPAEPARLETNGTEEWRARAALHAGSEEALKAEVGRLEADLHDLEKRSAEMDAIRKEIQAREGLSQNVATALERARLEGAAPPRASRLEEAPVPGVREERRPRLAGVAGLGGFALALFGVGLLECRRRRLHTISDVTRGLQLPVAGTQTLLPPALNPLDPKHQPAEGQPPWYGLPNDALDATRALVMHAAPPTAPRTVAVLSPVGGEGASVLAVQLAASLARAGRRTLLLDANLRRPALHRAFAAGATPGLAEILTGGAPLPSAVRAAPPERLWVLPAGAADVPALLALSREGTVRVLDQLKRDYDYVVIDTAPAVPCADALLLVQHCDAVLLSVLAGASAVPAVHSAWQRLTALGARLVGVVVHGAPDDRSGRPRYWFR